VCGSRATTSWIRFCGEESNPPREMDVYTSSAKTKSVAVSGAPSCQVRFGRSRYTVSIRPSGSTIQESVLSWGSVSARSAWGELCSSKRTRSALKICRVLMRFSPGPRFALSDPGSPRMAIVNVLPGRGESSVTRSAGDDPETEPGELDGDAQAANSTALTTRSADIRVHASNDGGCGALQPRAETAILSPQAKNPWTG